jgi:Protein kinase domain
MAPPRPASSSGSAAASATARSSKTARFLPGAMLSERYRIIAPLGKGGMGEVYRADDLLLGQEVALKFLPPEIAASPDAVDRFRNEVRVARQVSHPNVCRVYDFGETDGHLFLSMEYVDGEDLASLLRRIGRLPQDKGLDISRKLCAGLAAAHDKGVLHRDLKPGNVMIDGSGNVLLTDFGLAGLADRIAGNDIASGTPAYMAPEQAEAREVTARSDIYSLGLVLYEIFTGRRPFEGNTLAELMRSRSRSTPPSLSTAAKDLDPAIERVIFRCLESDPTRRPPSALSVSAALPGGDPLAAALAAGETPSPDMVAAAGEGVGLAPRVAIPVLAAVVLGVLAICLISARRSALDRIQPGFPPDVLAQKARDIAQRLGYPDHPRDEAYSFHWNQAFYDYVSKQDKPAPNWSDILARRPTLLHFWYRSSPDTMIGVQFHDDLLTPGMVDQGDPAPIESGMLRVNLDSQGRLVNFEAIPSHHLKKLDPVKPVDWGPLFAAAGLDEAQLKPADPEWTWLATSDQRAAWTGTWPGTKRPLRVEAAAFRGKPVAFALIGPWTEADRMPTPESLSGEMLVGIVLIVLLAVTLIGSYLLARRNLKQGRGDLRGAFRIAAALFWAEIALWACRVHLVLSIGTLGMAIIAVCTSAFYGLFIWTMYMALEPVARRRWPHSLISTTAVLSGRARDPIVGRDVLYGAALGAGIALFANCVDLWMSPSGFASPALDQLNALNGFRSAMAGVLATIPHAFRDALWYLFLLFLLRALLRNQWLATAGFASIFALLSLLGNNGGHLLAAAAATFVIVGAQAVAILRWGVLTMAVGTFLASVLQPIQITANTSAWYFGTDLFVLAIVLAVAAWAFRVSIGERHFLKADLL